MDEKAPNHPPRQPHESGEKEPELSLDEAMDIAARVNAEVLSGLSSEEKDDYARRYDAGDVQEALRYLREGPVRTRDEFESHIRSWMEGKKAEMLERTRRFGELAGQGRGQSAEDGVPDDEADAEANPGHFDAMDAENDPLYGEAVALGRQSGSITPQALSDSLQIPYGRAIRLINRMKEQGVLEQGENFRMATDSLPPDEGGSTDDEEGTPIPLRREGLLDTERVAEQNRRDAAEVQPEFDEIQTFAGMELDTDPLSDFIRNALKLDPHEFRNGYAARTAESLRDGGEENGIRYFSTYHDLLKYRSGLSREDMAQLGRDDEDGRKFNFSVSVVVDFRLRDMIGNPDNTELHAHLEEFNNLIMDLENEQVPDPYADVAEEMAETRERAWRAAEAVPDAYNKPEHDKEKKKHDPCVAFMRDAMGLSDDEIEKIDFSYSVCVGEEPDQDDPGKIRPKIKPAASYDDMLRLRRAIPEAERLELDRRVWADPEGFKWQKIRFLAEENFWDRLDGGDLSEHREAFYRLLDDYVTNEILPDTFAEEVLKKEGISITAPENAEAKTQEIEHTRREYRAAAARLAEVNRLLSENYARNPEGGDEHDRLIREASELENRISNLRFEIIIEASKSDSELTAIKTEIERNDREYTEEHDRDDRDDEKIQRLLEEGSELRRRRAERQNQIVEGTEEEVHDGAPRADKPIEEKPKTGEPAPEPIMISAFDGMGGVVVPTETEKGYKPLTVKESFEKEFHIEPKELESVGFNTLNDSQQRLVLENMRQLALGRIKEAAADAYRMDAANKEVLGSRRFGQIWMNIMKHREVAKLEKEASSVILAGGMNMHGEELKLLVEGAKSLRLGMREIGGRLVIDYTFGSEKDATAQERIAIDDFNLAADKLARIPYEWCLPTASPLQRIQYWQANRAYKKARIGFIDIGLKQTGNRENTVIAIMNDIDEKVRMNQFMSAHPEVEKALLDITDSGIITKSLKNVVTERGIYATMGYLSRTLSTSILKTLGAIEEVSSLGMGAIAGSGIMGGAISWMRSTQALHERDSAARKGKGDRSETARAYVAAEHITGRITGLVDRLNNVRQEVDAQIDKVQDVAKRKELEARREQIIDRRRAIILGRLRNRIDYARAKLDHGRVNFGGSGQHANAERIAHQLSLVQAIMAGVSELEVYESQVPNGKETRRTELEKRLEKYLKFKDRTSDAARRKYVLTQTALGATLGSTFATLGYALHSLSGDEQAAAGGSITNRDIRYENGRAVYGSVDEGEALPKRTTIDGNLGVSGAETPAESPAAPSEAPASVEKELEPAESAAPEIPQKEAEETVKTTGETEGASDHGQGEESELEQLNRIEESAGAQASLKEDADAADGRYEGEGEEGQHEIASSGGSEELAAEAANEPGSVLSFIDRKLSESHPDFADLSPDQKAYLIEYVAKEMEEGGHAPDPAAALSFENPELYSDMVAESDLPPEDKQALQEFFEKLANEKKPAPQPAAPLTEFQKRQNKFLPPIDRDSATPPARSAPRITNAADIGTRSSDIAQPAMAGDPQVSEVPAPRRMGQIRGGGSFGERADAAARAASEIHAMRSPLIAQAAELDKTLSNGLHVEDLPAIENQATAVRDGMKGESLMSQEAAVSRIARYKREFQNPNLAAVKLENSELKQMRSIAQIFTDIERAHAKTLESFNAELKKVNYTADAYEKNIKMVPGVTVKSVADLYEANKRAGKQNSRFMIWLYDKVKNAKDPNMPADAYIRSTYRMKSSTFGTKLAQALGAKPLGPQQ